MNRKHASCLWFLTLTALILAIMLAAPPAVQAAAADSPAVTSAPSPVHSVVLFAGFWDVIDKFMWQYRAWILTFGIVVVIFGFFLLYKGWK